MTETAALPRSTGPLNWARARVNNLAVRRAPAIANTMMRWHARNADRPIGRLYTRLWLSAPVYTLTVRGRKSGLPRSVALIAAFRGDDLIVVGGNAGATSTPEWFVNLRAAGEATVDVDGDWWSVDFREVTSQAEVRECRMAFANVYPGMNVYAAHSEREFPVGVLTRK